MDRIEGGIDHQQRDQQDQRQRHQEGDRRLALQRPAEAGAATDDVGRPLALLSLPCFLGRQQSPPACPPPASPRAAARDALAYVRMNPSISLSAQASVFSSGSPWVKRTTILVWIAC